MQASRIIFDSNCQSQEKDMSECVPIFWFLCFVWLRKPEKKPDSLDAPRTHPKIFSTCHEPIYFYLLLSVFPYHTTEVQRKGVQYPGEYDGKFKGRWVGGLVKGSNFQLV